MSCVCILTPVVIAAWPVFSAAVVSAATSLGYTVARELEENRQAQVPAEKRVQLDIPRSEVVLDSLNRDQRITVSREGVTVQFARDPRGRASICVTGQGQSEAELRAIGEELSQRVVQQYVYQRLMGEIQSRGYVIVEEEATADRAIRLKVRHWEA